MADPVEILKELLKNQNFRLAVTMGKIGGFSWIDKFGVNLDIATGPEDIWEAGGIYTYDADGTAPIVSLISSDAADTQPIEVQGLDIDGNLVTQTINLTGTTRVALDTPLWRVFRMGNVGTVDIAGMVYCYVGTGGVPVLGDTRAIIDNGHNQTLMALYTVPAGKVGFIMRGEIGLQFTSNVPSLTEYLHGHYESRQYGKVFRVAKSVSLPVTSNPYQDERPFPDPVPGKTDIRMRVIEVTAAMGAWATLDMLLVDEGFFPDEYLHSINQPGY